MDFIGSIKKTIKIFIPKPVRVRLWRTFNKYKLKYDIRKFKKQYLKTEKRIKAKTQLKVMFALFHDSVWKLDGVYRLMLKDPLFDPVIVILPYIAAESEDIMYDTMHKTQRFLESKGYNYFMSFDFENNNWHDIRKELQPDIIFISMPYFGYTKKEYFIYGFPDALICYNSYSSMVTNNSIVSADRIESLVWKYFVENSLIEDILQHKHPKYPIRTDITGYSAQDQLFDKKYTPNNVWLHEQTVKIIWAPHHTINDQIKHLTLSSFFEYAEFMVKLAAEYKDQIQIAFKPHPFLYTKLTDIWGKDKTDEYYDSWVNGPNTQFEDSDYLDLFLTSDAMIFDSGSFINEYLCTMKPSLFTCNPDVENQLNDFGKIALNCHQKAYSPDDVRSFVEDLINGSPDPKAEIKKEYYREYLIPPNGVSASQNIIDSIKKELEKTTCYD